MFARPLICPHCDKKAKYDLSDYITESDVIDEREMGSEIEHTIYAEELICKYCGLPFTVSGSIWEYPEKTYNSDDLKISV